MKNLSLKCICIPVVACLLTSLPFLLTAVEHIPTRQWQQIIRDKDLNYKDVTEMQVVKQVHAADNPLSKIITVITGFFFTTLGKSIVWISAFLLTAYFLFKALWKEKPGFAKTKKNEAISEAEFTPPEGIMETDWEKRRESALANDDLKLAIRCIYMQLLQLLQQKSVINYRPDKTNQEYYFELKDPNLKQLFRQLAMQYEFVWYGNYPVKNEVYRNVIENFRDFKDRIV